MKKSVLKVFSAVILLVGTFMVLGGCEEKKEPPTPQDIDIIDTTKAVLFKEVLPISADTVIIIAIKHRRSILQKGLYYLLLAIREVEYSKYP